MVEVLDVNRVSLMRNEKHYISARTNSCRPKILLIAGPLADKRIDLMHALEDEFTFAMAGSSPSHFAAPGASPSLQSNFIQHGFKFFYYPLYRGFNPLPDISTILSLWRLIRRYRPQIVHTFGTKPGVWGRLAARLAGVPIVMGTLPGLGTLYVNNSFSTRLIRFVYRYLQGVACHVSDLTTFQHQDDAQQFITERIVPEKKAIIIPGSGIRTDLFNSQNISQAERKRVRIELNIPANAVLVTMISRLLRSKGVLEFASAARVVKQHAPEVKFLLVGPHDTDNINHLTSDEVSQLVHDVIWAGTRSDIPAILAASDIFAFPSFYREGIPRALIEAASMELPIITTDTPGCREVVKHEVNGFLVPRHDISPLTRAILRLAKNPEIRSQFGQRSRKHAVTYFDLKVVAEKTRVVYHDLLSSKGLVTTEKNE